MADPLSEKRTKRGFYVPRDECFSEIKQLTFSAKTLYSVLHALAPSLGTVMVDKNLGFKYFTAIDSLFSEGVDLPPIGNQGFLRTILPRVVKSITDTGGDVLRFESPETFNSTYNSHAYTHIYLFMALIHSWFWLQGTNFFGLGTRNLQGKLLPDSTPVLYG